MDRVLLALQLHDGEAAAGSEARALAGRSFGEQRLDGPDGVRAVLEQIGCGSGAPDCGNGHVSVPTKGTGNPKSAVHKSKRSFGRARRPMPSMHRLLTK